MPGRYQRPSTPAEQGRDQADADKLTALHGRLAEAVNRLHSGPEWRRWLDVAARFHTYSFNNTLAITMQHPDATVVAGYQTWRSLGRQVGKGEKGIQILAPIIGRPRDSHDQSTVDNPDHSSDGRPRPATGAPTETDPTTEPATGQQAGRRLAGFRVAYVWDVSSTTGKPLPEQPRPQLLTGQAPPGLWDSLARLVADRGYTLERGDCGPANGYTNFTSRTVRVRADVDDAQAVRTLAHETGHVLLHDPAERAGAPPGPTGVESTTVGCRGTREVEAESVAYLVSAAHGLATDDYTFGYVTGWAADVADADPGQVVRATGQRVLAAARAVLAVTQPDTTSSPADTSLQARVQAGAERTPTRRQHADTTLARTPPTAPNQTVMAPAPGVEVLARLHADAAAFYTDQLASGTPDASRARTVLGERAVPPAVAAAYELGYAPPGWTVLTEHLRGRGYTDAQLLAAGMGLTTRRGSVVDRFRDRIMFPVRDPAGGPVIAFLGRAMVEADGTPKYLNSPETLLYRKSEVLYGLGTGSVRRALAAGACPVLVEGALDAIAVTSAGAGRYVGVAPSGTALTASQVALLDRAAGPLAGRGVLVCFDADPAGRQAGLRAFPLLRAAGAWPAVAGLPDGQDPASYAQHHGGDALRAVLDASSPLADLAVDDRLAAWAGRLQWPEGQIGAARHATDLIAGFPAEQTPRQVGRVAAHTGLNTAAVTGLLTDAVHRDAEAAGRPGREDRRGDLDRGQATVVAPTGPLTAAGLARAGYPTPVRSARHPDMAVNDPGAAVAPRPSPAVGRDATASRPGLGHGLRR